MTNVGWYSPSGATVSATNGSANITLVGTALLSNVVAGQGIMLPDGHIYQLTAIGSDTTATISPNYMGSTVSGGFFQVAPIQGFQASLAQQVAAMVNSVAAYTSLAPSAGNYLQYLGSPVVPTVRTQAQVLVDLASNMTEVNVASASTCDIGTVTTPRVQITGTTAITSLGTVPNSIRFVRFAGAVTLTYNATSLILPGANNITTVAGDTAIFISDSSGNWRCQSYQGSGISISGGMLGFGCVPNNPITIGAGSGSSGVSNAGNGILFATAGNGLLLGGNGSSNDFLLINSAGAGVLGIPHGTTNLTTYGQVIFASGTTAAATWTGAGNTPQGILYGNSVGAYVGTNNNYPFGILVNGSEVARFDNTSGKGLRIGTTSYIFANEGLSVLTGTDGYTSIGALGNGLNSASAVGIFGKTTAHTAAFVLSFYDATTTHFDGSVSMGSGSTNFNTTSDARLKDIEVEQINYRAAIKKLWIGNFDKYGDFEHTGTPNRHFGILAQQAYDVLGGLGVTKPANDDDEWHASAEPFGHLALWGTKDQYAILDSHSSIISGHEVRIAALEAEIAQLKKAA